MNEFVTGSDAFMKGFHNSFNFSFSGPSIQIKTQEDDYEALRKDWENVGKAISVATQEYKKSCITK